jgi:hypothetical protein
VTVAPQRRGCAFFRAVTTPAARPETRTSEARPAANAASALTITRHPMPDRASADSGISDMTADGDSVSKHAALYPV